MASANGRLFIAQAQGVDIFAQDKFAGTEPAKDYTPTAIAAYGSKVVVGNDKNSLGK